MDMREKKEQHACDILLVDNKKVSREMVQRLLEHEGYRVVTAEHGQEAISLLSHEGFACRLVITETVMPYVNGFELISFIKSESGIPVMVLSGSGDEQTVSEVFRLRADDFMKKPFLDAELRLRVRQLLAFARPAGLLARVKELPLVKDRSVKGKKALHEGAPVAVRLAS